MFNSIKKSFFWGGFSAVVIFVFIAGIYFGYTNRPEVQKITALLNKEEPAGLSEVDFDPFWKAWNIIESKYVSNDGLNRQDMVWGAISGLVASLKDPYSTFMPPQEAAVFQSTVRGDFVGVGMEVGMKDGVLTVIAPLKNTPADRAGIKAGDQILKINETITADLSIDDAVGMIRGEQGTEVVLSILRKGMDEPIQIKIKREIIEIPVLETGQKNGGIFVISLYNFSGHSADEFRGALRKMINSGSSKLIVDLRGNPGGYLEAAVDICSWFLSTGEVIAREHFSTGEETLYRSKGYDIFQNLPMVILVNKGSASASEIMAGALREHGLAKLVGETTYGKGSVQELMDVADGSSLKLTIARWLTPDGNTISEKGLEPDEKVEMTLEDVNAGKDPQMDRAIEILKRK